MCHCCPSNTRRNYSHDGVCEAKGSIGVLYKYADTLFWLCMADLKLLEIMFKFEIVLVFLRIFLVM